MPPVYRRAAQALAPKWRDLVVAVTTAILTWLTNWFGQGGLTP